MKNGEAFKGELYYQVMKQLCKNPSRPSLLKGWEMMTLLLSNFAPPKDIENVVALFLRKQAPPEIVHNCRCALYSIMYASPKTTPPTLEEITATTKGFSRIEFDERFLTEDLIVVTDFAPPVVPTPIATAESSASVAKPSPPAANATTKPAAPPPPPPPPPVSNPMAKALYDFPSDEPGKVSLVANQVYELIDDSSDAWWLVQHDGHQGWAPGSYMQKL